VEDKSMDDLMARTMVENLAIGINPITGRVLPKSDACSNELIQTAIKTVLDACTIESYGTLLKRQQEDKKAEVERRKEERMRRFPQSGKPWTTAEEHNLVALYHKGYAISHIANILKRSSGAIRSHLTKLGYD